MNDPFQNHGINFLSPTQINEFIANPARWLLWVSGVRDKEGIPAMWRGIAADRAITKAAFFPRTDHREIIALALDRFDQEMRECQEAGRPFDRIKAKKERESLVGYTDTGASFYKTLSMPVSHQQRISLEFEELPIPIIGYYDLLYDDCVRDIKTAARKPSKITDAISRQLSVYSAATKAPAFADYVVHNGKTQGVFTFPLVGADRYLVQVRRAALGMMTVLSHSSDIYECCRLVYPDLDSWRWSQEEREAAKKIWEIPL